MLVHYDSIHQSWWKRLFNGNATGSCA